MHRIAIYTFYLPCRGTNLLLSTLSSKALYLFTRVNLIHNFMALKDQQLYIERQMY